MGFAVKASTDNEPVEINVEVILEDILVRYGDILSSVDLENYNIPIGPIIQDIKDVPDQMIEDYDDFIESVEDMLIDNYDLELIYFNSSPYNSRYYSFLAKDSDGNIIVRFGLNLRISNHKASRTKKSEEFKKQQKEELKKWMTENQFKKVRMLRKTIIVNDDYYTDYFDAFQDIDKIVEDAVNTIHKRSRR